MNSLVTRYKQTWLVFSLIVSVTLVLLGDLPGNNLFWREAQNTGHTLLFAIVAVVVLSLLQNANVFSRLIPLKLYVLACLLSLAIGVSTEIIQWMMLRDASRMDVLRDFAGIIIGLGLYAWFDPEMSAGRLKARVLYRYLFFVLAICVFAVSLSPLAVLSLAYIQRESEFPVVVDFTAPWSDAFLKYKSTVKSKLFKGGAVDKAAKLNFDAATYPGVSMIEPHPDWATYKILVLTVYSQSSEPVNLVLRVHDEQHNNEYADRFNVKLLVHRGENNFRVPLHDIENAPIEREMDMKRISNVTLFIDQPTSPLSLYIGAINLE